MKTPSLRKVAGSLAFGAACLALPVAALATTTQSPDSLAPPTTQAPAAENQQPSEKPRPDPSVMEAFHACMKENGIEEPKHHIGRGPGKPGERVLKEQAPEAAPDVPAMAMKPDPAVFKAAFDACKDKLPEDVRANMEEQQAKHEAFRNCLTENGMPVPPKAGEEGSFTPPTPEVAKAAHEACKDLAPKPGPGGHGGHGGPGGPGGCLGNPGGPGPQIAPEPPAAEGSSTITPADESTVL